MSKYERRLNTHSLLLHIRICLPPYSFLHVPWKHFLHSHRRRCNGLRRIFECCFQRYFLWNNSMASFHSYQQKIGTTKIVHKVFSSLVFSLRHKTYKSNFASALVTKQHQFYQFIFLNLCIYDPIDFLRFVIRRYYDPTFWTRKSSIPINFCQIHNVHQAFLCGCFFHHFSTPFYHTLIPCSAKNIINNYESPIQITRISKMLRRMYSCNLRKRHSIPNIFKSANEPSQSLYSYSETS